MNIIKKIFKYLGYILISAIVIFCLLLIISVFLPSKWTVQKSVEIQASPEYVFDYLGEIKNWPEWLDWKTSLDPTLTHAFHGPISGQDAAMTWNGLILGSGTLIFDNVEDDQNLIEYTMLFDKQRAVSQGFIEITESDDVAILTWVETGDVGFDPVSRYALIFNKDEIDAPYNLGLFNIKKNIEGK